MVETKEEAKKIKSYNFGDNLFVHNYIPYKKYIKNLKILIFVFCRIQKKLQSLVMLETYLIIHLH